MRLGDTSLPTLGWPGPFSSDPINLVVSDPPAGTNTGQTLFMASFKTLVFLAARLRSVLPMLVQFLRIMKLSPVTRMSNCLSELSPPAWGDTDPFIPRHYARDYHPDRTASG